MIEIIQEETAHLHPAQMAALETLRSNVEKGTGIFRLTAKAPLTQDFANSRYLHFIMYEEGEAVAAVTVMRGDQSTASASDHFAFMKQFRKFPFGADVLDIVEFIVAYPEDDKALLTHRSNELMRALYEFAVEESSEFFISILKAPFFSTLLSIGFPVHALSFPIKVEDEFVVCVQIPVQEKELQSLRRLTSRGMPRAEEQQCSVPPVYRGNKYEALSAVH